MKYEELEEKLRRDMETGRFGTELPSSRELARLYESTRPSIDRAIGELRAAGLLESIPRVGHRIVEKKAGPLTVAWLWPDEAGPGSLFHEAFDAVRNGFPREHNLLVQQCANDEAMERRALLKLIQMGVEGVFALPRMLDGRLVNLDLWQKLQRLNTKIVFMMRDVREIPATCIFYDQKTVVDATLNLLTAKGARCLVYLADDNSLNLTRKVHFDLVWRLRTQGHWFEFEGSYAHSIESIIGAMVKKFKKAGLDTVEGPIGFAGGHDHYCYGAWRACQVLGIKDETYASIGYTRSDMADFLKVDLSAVPSGVFDYPRLSFRAGEIGAAALERMIYMLTERKSVADTLSFPVKYPEN